MTSNEIKVDLLKRARALIESGEKTAICFALEDVAWKEDNEKYFRAYGALTELILTRLSPHTYLTTWLREQGYNTDCFGAADKLRHTRIAWINSMIEEHGGTP